MDAAKEFVAPASLPRLDRMLADLETGRDDTTAFTWETKRGEPIETRVATEYDSMTGTRDPVIVSMGFFAKFTKRSEKKSPDWDVDRMETHIKIQAENKNDPALWFHVDKKNTGQLGPATHLQIDEECCEFLGDIKLSVPRFPFGFVLPTDCLDFIMAEFFPMEWGQRLAGIHAFGALRESQLARLHLFAGSILADMNNRKKQTPVGILQDCDFVEGLRLV
ncbi:MAG: hypothetical protein JWO81_37 [Alphaproteobacteria bacterium]|nr:hypothetical protein [Alphaproteobacteria bacterium]